VFVYHYYIATEGLILALEEVNGDISGGQKKLQEALAGVEFDAAYGHIALDENLSAISNNYVQRIVPDLNGDKVPDAKTIRVLTDVDQQFGGLFSADAPAPDRENPKCVKGSPPEWVGNAEEVG
jgi:branched-chain amino acid transport system substrate-binding protein